MEGLAKEKEIIQNRSVESELEKSHKSNFSSLWWNPVRVAVRSTAFGTPRPLKQWITLVVLAMVFLMTACELGHLWGTIRDKNRFDKIRDAFQALCEANGGDFHPPGTGKSHYTCELPCYPDLHCPYIVYVKLTDDGDNKFQPKGKDGKWDQPPYENETGDDEVICTEGPGNPGPENPRIPCPLDITVANLRTSCIAEGGIWQENSNLYSCSGVGWDYAGIIEDKNSDGIINEWDDYHCETVTSEGLPSDTIVDCPWQGMDIE